VCYQFFSDELCSFDVWNADGICCSGLDVQTAPRRLGEFLKRGQWFFFNPTEADMRNHGVQAMLYPCIDCLNQKKFAQREINFHHLVTRGFTKNYTCWNKHGEEGLNELEAGCLNEGEVRQHATDHDEDLNDSGLFEENEPLFTPNVLRPEDITDKEVRGFNDGEVLQRVHNVDQMLWDVEFQ
jgi:hypothetical protein